MQLRKLTILTTAILLLVGYSAKAGTVHEVEISSFDFTPGEQEVEVGDVILWENTSGTAHTTTSTSTPEEAEGWDETLSEGETFEYKVEVPGQYEYHCAIHAGGPNAHDGSFTAEGVGTFSEEAIEANLHINFYPNPASKELNIEIGNDLQNGSIELINMQGKEVLQEEASGEEKVSLDVGSLSEGIYLLNIPTASGNFREKIIVE